MSNPTEMQEEVLQDLMARRWTKLAGEAPTGTPALHVGAAVVPWDDGRVVITGGFENGTIRATNSVLVYNKETMETEALPSMLQTRSHHSAVIAGGNLFVIGGDCAGVWNSIEVLDLNDPHEWKLFPVSLEVARFHCSAVAVNEHEIYIIGGYDDVRSLNSVEILNISTKTISQGPSMLESRYGFAAAMVGDSIVVAGGFGGGESTCEQLSTRAGSDEEARQWQPLQSMTTADRANHHGLSFENYMVVIRGVSATSSRMAEVWHGTTGEWTQLPARLPGGGPIRGFVKLGKDLVCFDGGDNPSVYCLFSAKGLLEHQRRKIRFNELIADERVEIVIPLLLEGLGQRGWTSLFMNAFVRQMDVSFRDERDPIWVSDNARADEMIARCNGTF